MSNLTNFWQLPANEQQQFQQPHSTSYDPAQYTLTDVFNTNIENELAMCASGLFIMIVQDRGDGGYGLHVLALGKCVQRHFETQEAVETWLAAKCPYVAGIAAWVPLPSFYSKMHETEIWARFREEPEYERAQEG